MNTTGCAHPESDVLVLHASNHEIVKWCGLCGSVFDSNGNHEAEPRTWRAPASIVLLGWTCSKCQTFNGAEKELHDICRGCEAPRKEP